MPQAAEALRPPAGIPVSPIHPFAFEFLRDPHPAHDALREAGPVVWLEGYGIYASARYAEVKQMLDDPAKFCSSRGVGLADFARKRRGARRASCSSATRPSTIAPAPCSTARSPPRSCVRCARDLPRPRRRWPAELARRGRFDAIADCAEVYPMMVMPDAVGLSNEGREHLLPYAATVFNMFGPDNDLRRAALAQMAPHVAWIAHAVQARNARARRHRGDDPRCGGRGRGDAAPRRSCSCARC